MFSWSLLIALAPDLIPIVVNTIINIEQAIRGIGNGAVKKSKVLAVVRAFLETKDYFVTSDSDKQSEIFSLVSQAIDFFVSAFNYLGLFKTSKKASFAPVPPAPPEPVQPELPFEEGPNNENG